MGTETRARQRIDDFCEAAVNRAALRCAQGGPRKHGGKEEQMVCSSKGVQFVTAVPAVRRATHRRDARSRCHTVPALLAPSSLLETSRQCPVAPRQPTKGSTGAEKWRTQSQCIIAVAVPRRSSIPQEGKHRSQKAPRSTDGANGRSRSQKRRRHAPMRVCSIRLAPHSPLRSSGPSADGSFRLQH